jgi:transcriptional regulator with XRE-family HTH domain
MNMKINIPQRLKDLRKETGFSQQTVADGIEIKRTAYQAYEEARATPPLETLVSLSILYGFKTINELLGITEPEKKLDNMLDAYYRADPDKRKIVDFILNLNC